MLNKYVFTDITVFMRNRNGKYINLTDYEITEEENEALNFKTNSKFIIMICSFMYNANKTSEEKNFICDVSIDELVRLAGINDSVFIERVKSSSGENRDDILAILCAKRIVDYRYGKIYRKNEKGSNCYTFTRLGYDTTGEKKKKIHNVIFEKEFYEA